MKTEVRRGSKDVPILVQLGLCYFNLFIVIAITTGHTLGAISLDAGRMIESTKFAADEMFIDCMKKARTSVFRVGGSIVPAYNVAANVDEFIDVFGSSLVSSSERRTFAHGVLFPFTMCTL